MQMYVNHYDRQVQLPEENPTVGILLCHDKSDFVVEYFVVPLVSFLAFANVPVR